MKYFQRKSISQVFQEPNQNELNLLPDLENLKFEKLYCTIKMQRLYQNTKSILWKQILLFKKIFFTQCHEIDKIFENLNKLVIQCWMVLYLNEKLLMPEIKTPLLKIKFYTKTQRNQYIKWRILLMNLLTLIRLGTWLQRQKQAKIERNQHLAPQMLKNTLILWTQKEYLDLKVSSNQTLIKNSSKTTSTKFLMGSQ